MKNLLSTFIFKSVDPLKRTDSKVWFIWESDYTDRAQFCSLESLAVLWREWIMQETLSKYFSMVFWLPQEKTACVRTLNRNKRHFYCPSLSPSLLTWLWAIEYMSVVLFCYILDVMLCYVMLCYVWKKKKNVDNKKKETNIRFRY